MNLYKISQKVNNDYDTFDSAIVAAENEDEARKIHPAEYLDSELWQWWEAGDHRGTWCYKLEEVQVELLGVAKDGTKSGVILSSFNAG